ncbi:MAG: methyl-accepting chemotaxis protein [Betaproteobacteria bacterium]|nr:methyl-accepting chemotaxis protein [Betaproteobacteria bacterium]
MLAVTWTVMIVLTYSERREATIGQARDFAESTNQMINATLTGMMITGVSKQRAVFLDQVRESNNIKNLRVVRSGSVIAQYGAGDATEGNPSADETAAMKSGKASFSVNEKEGYLSAIFPILNWRAYLGKECMGCHQGAENDVLGAVSMRVSLRQAQAELSGFAWRISLLALGLALPLLGAIYFFVHRFVSRPLGGEPAAATAVANRIAGGDLAHELAVRQGDTTSLMAAMAKMQKNLAGIIGQINEAAGTITIASREIAAGNADLSQRTEEQASSLEETASSMEELTSTVKQNAENARQANQLVIGASAVAVKGGKVVSEVVGTMSSINESSKKIVDIISVIDGIAFQTNILALNAAVEAARAGEQGRGFAVVASEVRNLAQRSAVAAKEIKQLISDSVDKVGAGTKLVDEAGKTMEEIVTSVKRVTDIMSEITAASQEQSAGIEQVNQAIAQMDDVTQQNAALVEQAAAAVESMQEQTTHLTQAVAAFNVGKAAAGGSAKAAAQEGQPARPAAERRGPNRASNVARLPVKPAQAWAGAAKAKAAAGGEDQWEEF